MLIHACLFSGFNMKERFHIEGIFTHHLSRVKEIYLCFAARYFLTRALLGVENFVQAQQTLRNEGCGAAEGFSVNMTFLAQEGDRMFHNAEVGPAKEGTTRSQLNILTVSPGENTSHCNKYTII